MTHRLTALLAGLALMATACEPTTPDPTPPDPACVSEVLPQFGCTGCHNTESAAAGLDLTGDELGARLIGAAAHTASCRDRVLIDPQRPERSLMLQAVGAVAPPGGAEDPCQLIMPPNAEGPADLELRACMTDWIFGIAVAQPPPADFQPTPVAAAVTKVKALLDGEAPTADELQRATDDPAELRAMVDAWANPQNPRFANKLAGFFEVNLQQRVQIAADDQFDRVQVARVYRQMIPQVMGESFVRTALAIVDRGAPFTEILTTRTWMLTTANIVQLLYTDQTADERNSLHQLTPVERGGEAPLEQQIADRTWTIPGLSANLGRCRRGVPQTDLYDLLHGFVAARCNEGRNLLFAPTPITEADFNDWRPVELVPVEGAGEIIPFYDLPAVRAVDGTLRLRMPRTGFFTTPAFFANWATNIDNQFRVTINQTVLAALHAGFSQTEPTPRPTADDAAIPIEHVEGVNSDCYGCHKNLDPMRVYFANTYNVRYQLPHSAPETADGLIYDPMPESGFGLLGHNRVGGGVNALAEALASHPRFATSWAQKLCLYANSARCDESDPTFVRIVDRFRDGYDFRRLIVDLLSSPLVTGLEQTPTWGNDGPLVSITRRDHLCPMLDARTGFDGICEHNRIAPLIGLVPRDDFARGAADPVQPAQPSAFHFAAVRRVCEGMAPLVVNNRSEIYNQGEPAAALQNMVGRLMALPEGHPRRAATQAELQAHFQAARDGGLNVRDSLRTAFVLACTSPDVMGMGL